MISFATRSLLLLLLSAASLIAGPKEEALPEHFIKAKEAYDTEQFAVASEHYQAILDSGFHTPEVYYNLGNTLFRQGEFGGAILNYKRAQHLQPFDSSIRANLNFAQNQAGAIIPGTPPFEAPFRLLSTSQWRWALIGAYWIAGIGIAGYFLLGRPTLLRKALPLVCVALGTTALGFAGNKAFSAKATAVVLENDVEALFAPLEDSDPHFKLPQGSVVVIQETSGTWLKVKSGQEKGWIPKSSCERVVNW